MTNDLFHDRLRDAADDTGQPLTTDMDDLLHRARRRRSRHRARTAGAVLVTTAALVGTTLGVRAALPDDSRPAAGDRTTTEKGDKDTDTTVASPPLGDREVIRRCLPQLDKYAAYPQYAVPQRPAAWQVARDRTYAPGDLVALQVRDGSGNAVLCVLPEQGHEQDPVPFAALQPTPSDPARLAEVCSETFLPQPMTSNQGRFIGWDPTPLPDLRGANVAAVDSSGPVVVSLLVKDGARYSCALSPVTWDAGPNGVTMIGESAPAGYDVFAEGSATGPDAKSIVDENAAYYYAAGWMPDDAATVEFTLDDGNAFTVPVRNGGYAFVHKELGFSGLAGYDYRVLDGNGRVLHTGSQQ